MENFENEVNRAARQPGACIYYYVNLVYPEIVHVTWLERTNLPRLYPQTIIIEAFNHPASSVLLTILPTPIYNW